MSFSKNHSTELLDITGKSEQKPKVHGDITHEESLLIMRVLMYGVTPGISIFGIVGNIFSIIILRKHGLHKCSNILLLCLAVTDLTFLVAFNSIPKIVYEVVGIQHFWECSRDVCYVLFIWYNIFNILDYGMGPISLAIPMLITIERLVAVYLPFKFGSIITPIRTWCVVACVYIFWFSISIYMSFWFKLSYTFNTEYNITLGTMERTDFFYNHPQSVSLIDNLFDFMSMKIPPAVTLVGCGLIIVRVKMASIQRKKMTNANSKEASSNRTTKMMLAVCGFYLITCFAMSLPVYFPHIMYWTASSDAPTNVGRIIYQVINTVSCVNSSVNFVIYVGMNKNFRDTYKSLFLVCISSQKK